MKVIKKDGRIQDFDLKKILLTIENASDDAEAPMTGSDIHHMGEVITEKIQAVGLDPIPTKDIQALVLSVLTEMGFSVVARYYSEHPA